MASTVHVTVLVCHNDTEIEKGETCNVVPAQALRWSAAPYLERMQSDVRERPR